MKNLKFGFLRFYRFSKKLKPRFLKRTSSPAGRSLESILWMWRLVCVFLWLELQLIRN